MVKLDSVIFDFYDQVNFYIFRLILWYFCSYLIVLSMKLRYCLGGPGGCVGLGGPIGLVGLVKDSYRDGQNTPQRFSKI